MLTAGPRPTRQVAVPGIEPGQFARKQMLGVAQEVADLGASQQPNPAAKAMPTGRLQAPLHPEGAATYGDAAPSAMGRVLPGNEMVAETPGQQMERMETLHANNERRRVESRGLEGARGQMQTVPANLAQTAADLQRQRVGMALQGERGDRTPFAPVSQEALSYMLKEAHAPRRQPSIM